MLTALAAHPALASLDRSERNLALGITVSVLFHALLLAIHFTYPDALVNAKERVLDVVLVNSKHKTRPTDAQARAQTNLDGGGNTDEERLATTPLPPSAQVRAGDDLISAQQRVAQLETQQQETLTRIKSDHAIISDIRHDEQVLSPNQTPGLDLISRSKAVARLEAQIDRQVDDYNKRPRKTFIGARTTEYLPAQYVEDWRQKVERVGNLNYPEAARGKLYGSLTVYIEINSAGELLRAEIQRSSGQKVLDEAALRILRLAAPYGQFSAELKRQMDVLAFARVWTFSQGDQLHDKAAQ